MQWLLTHPATATITTATVPLNHAAAPQLLASLVNLHELTLFVAIKPILGPEPSLASLPLGDLSHLTTLKLPLEYGALSKGETLPVPDKLSSLALSASSLNPAMNALNTPKLEHTLRYLDLSVMDTTNCKPLRQLAALKGLRHLKVGRFWHVPDEIHGLMNIDELEVAVYGKVMKAPIGELDHVSAVEDSILTAKLCWLRALAS